MTLAHFFGDELLLPVLAHKTGAAGANWPAGVLGPGVSGPGCALAAGGRSCQSNPSIIRLRNRSGSWAGAKRPAFQDFNKSVVALFGILLSPFLPSGLALRKSSVAARQ